jgi:hypothetical protein
LKDIIQYRGPNARFPEAKVAEEEVNWHTVRLREEARKLYASFTHPRGRVVGDEFGVTGP